MQPTVYDNRVLIVDDELDIVDMLKSEVSKYVKNVEAVMDPYEALEVFKTQEVDVALLDINMPKMDGLMLVQEIKKISPNTTCIMVTASSSKENIQTAMRFGAYDFIEKPFKNVLLKLCIVRGLERSFFDHLSNDIMKLFFESGYLKKEDLDKLGFDGKKKEIKKALLAVREKVMQK